MSSGVRRISGGLALKKTGLVARATSTGTWRHDVWSQPSTRASTPQKPQREFPRLADHVVEILDGKAGRHLTASAANANRPA